MITGKSEELADIVKTHLCPEHPDKGLTLAWLKDQGYAVRCGGGTHTELALLKPGETQQREVNVPGHYPDEVTRQLSPTEMYKQGEVLPPAVKDSVEKGLRKRGAASLPQPGKRLLDSMPKEDLGTGVALNAQMIVELYQYARQYRLDAYRGHVMLMYGKPYVGIDGYLYYARKSKIPYTLSSRPLKEDELKEFRFPDNAHVWLSHVTFTATGQEFTGYGVVTKEEMEAKSPRDATKLRSPVVASHPWQLAQKRAEWQALRRAFPIGETEEVKEE